MESPNREEHQPQTTDKDRVYDRNPLPSYRLPGESVLQCVDRLQKATLGETGQAILRGVSLTGLFTAGANASLFPKTTEVTDIATRETTTVATRISLVSKLSEVFPKGVSAAVKSVSPVIGKVSGIVAVGVICPPEISPAEM
jgi:hypothetical protein